MRRKLIPLCGGLSTLLLGGLLLSRAQEEARNLGEAEHPECTFFGPQRDKFLRARAVAANSETSLNRITDRVVRLAFVPGGSRTKSFQDLEGLGTIDRHLFADMEANVVTPAERADDFTFIRRATLDLTGRLPLPERVIVFANDASPDKRSRLIDELLGRAEWVDKWTMYFGDLYQNTTLKPSVNLRLYEPGRNAFWKWIKDSLAADKPYNQMATELIAAQGNHNYVQGPINWLVGGWVINNPQHDNWDQQAANVAETFLGVAHMNCILCHNGRGHLDSLSLWGKTATRAEAWGLASFLSRTTTVSAALDASVQNSARYWRLDEVPQRQGDYPLGTVTGGNRPVRTPIGSVRNVAPVYPFSGRGPAPGENYRVTLAREVTSDFQFARAAVNYIWREFFGRGLVEPANAFDPARLDPDNPPPETWRLQTSNARLLNGLAQDFIDSGYNLKALMRQICTSEAYQLSSRYDGAAPPEKYFARKFVRRLWAEELHDALAQSSNILPSYTIDGFSSFRNTQYAPYPSYGPVQLAMQFPDVVGMPGGGFMDAFIRGDRDGEDRRQEGSLLQALNLMNDPFVTSRISATGPVTSLLRRALSMPDLELVNTLYLTVLSRYPSEAEMSAALARLRSGVRNRAAENLLWSLYNKVDFTFVL